MEIFEKAVPLRCFYMAVTEKFECFQYFNFETNFLESGNLSAFSEHWNTVFQLKVLESV